MPASVEIINTGNELLDGRTPNTNGQWMARKCSSRGLEVKRITVVGDSLEEIRSALREALSRKPDLILITGGLGPTPDDMTARAIAEALGRELVLNEEALEMVKRAYGLEELGPSREKMAWLPEGARPLRNPVGTAPGIMVEHGGTVIIALPGVPREMEAMFEEHVEPLLEQLSAGLAKFEAYFLVYGVREADIADLLEEVARRHPDVYVKTHPKVEEGRTYLEIYVSTTADSSSKAKKKMGEVIHELSEGISSRGGSLKPFMPGQAQ